MENEKKEDKIKEILHLLAKKKRGRPHGAANKKRGPRAKELDVQQFRADLHKITKLKAELVEQTLNAECDPIARVSKIAVSISMLCFP